LSVTSVKAPLKTKVKLITNRLLTYSTDKVDVYIPVEKFTEGVIEVPVQPTNLAKGFSLKTFPDKVKVRYMVSLSRYNKISPAMFKAVVDASGLEKEHPEKIVVQLIQKPEFIRMAELESERLDYIMRKE
jgi:hypothetical protein